MASLESFVTAFHDHYSRNPNRRVVMGINRDLDQLPDPSVSEAESSLSEARSLLDMCESIDRSSLTDDESLDLDLAQLKLEAEIHDATLEFAGATTLVQKPTAGDDIGDAIFLMFINDPRPATDRLSDILGRIEGIPRYLDTLVSRLERPVRRWVDIDVEKVEGLPHLFETISGWAAEENWSRRAALGTAIERASESLTRYKSALRELPVHEHFAIGAGETEKLIRLRGIDASAEDLRAMAAEFLSEIFDTLDKLRGQLAAKYDLPETASIAEVHTELNRRFAVEAEKLDDILVHYQRERERIVEFCRERELFPIPPDQDFKILRTPPFMAPSIPAGAMMSPPPFREGVRTSLVYLTLAEELRDEHTALGIPNMIIHEGIPGHHLQLAAAANHPSRIRRHIDANDQAEGWTTMLEDYMLDIGVMGDLEAEARFVGKRDIARLGARVAIDLFFMSGDKRYLEVGIDFDNSSDDPFVCAGNLLKQVTGFTDERVQSELNWYSQERGYPLSYLAGNKAVWQLRREAEHHTQDSGDAFARKFHDAFLDAGSMPVSMLRRAFASAGLVAEATSDGR